MQQNTGSFESGRARLGVNRIAQFVLVGAFLGAPLAALAQQASVEDLDQRIKILERQLEIQKDEAETKAKDATTSKIDDKGVSIKKGDFEFKFKGLAQADARYFLDDFNPTGVALTPTSNRDALYFNDTVLLRRVEPTFELTLGKLLFFRLQPQFAGDTASTADVYAELRFRPEFVVRAGKFKGPVSLENLRSTSAITFIERGFPTELGPNRDLGIQVGGDLFDSRLNYALGYFNGTPDGRDANGTSDPDNRKEIGARLFAEPFRNDPGFLQGLGFGVGGTTGPRSGNVASVANDFLPRYRTPGQNTFFSYQAAAAAAGANPATLGVLADGRATRIEPQAYWYWNSFGLLGEWISSKQALARGDHNDKLTNKAWQIAANYFLTGEDAAYRGLARVNQPFTGGGAGWGAFEVAARYGELDIDDDAFDGDAATRFANPATQASEAKAWTAALNWYPTVNVKIALNYSETSFDGGSASSSGDRKDEKALFTRFQINF